MLLHKLALRMGRRVPELASTMTSGELASWFAFDRISPIGDQRMDFLFARLMLLVCDAVGVKKAGGARFTFEDFLMWKPKPVMVNQSPLEFLRSRMAGRIQGKK